MDHLPKIAIIYLSFHSEPFIERAMDAISKLNYPRDRLGLFIVDNPHPEAGPAQQHIEKMVLPRSEKDLPLLHLFPQTMNKGFAGGNNVGIRAALAAGFEYVYLHNQDGFMAPDCLAPLVGVLERDQRVGVLQSLILLYPETKRINSAGNCWHYLGFGYCGEFRKKVSDHSLTTSSERRGETDALVVSVDLPLLTEEGTKGWFHPIGYASGAGLMLRASLLTEHGLLDEDLFAYHEDLEYSLRLQSRGFQIALCPESVFYHEYSFGRNSRKFYLMERNRFAVILMYYRWRTILLLLPMAIVLEVGMLWFALSSGWLKQKLWVYWYWLWPGHWSLWLRKRRDIQARRTVSDADLFGSAVATIEFDDQLTQGWALKRVGNPMLAAYWKIVRRLL